ncbi:recombinase family protein [Clostridium bowmanii]|uniref:recombinase family protein n=1 Tax=Clostridium bowmanii TaxID=132925 RepID=UPI001C0B4731|nr:recombinase family protein [Clostridium bowmanii]MBU3188742.1 recombinase family protein [Clostridium bowmanii]MCA1073327.1 recombinase family protein [Clostridium bowmanii]
MRVYGYHRTSTQEQHLDRGINAIKEYCIINNMELEYTFTDQATGKNFDRPDYIQLKKQAKKNDIIIISEVDRLGRNKQSTLDELRYFKDNGIRIMILELPTTLVNYSIMKNDMAEMMMETINNMLIEMYASFAHAEMMKRQKRQTEGIQAMKDRGEWDNYGRPTTIKINDNFKIIYKQWKDGEITAVKSMELNNMSKATFYRKVKEYEGR